MINHKKVSSVLLSSLVVFSLLAGCGSDGKVSELESYEKDLLDFKSAVEDIGTKINEIDATHDDCKNELLFYVDALKDDFKKLSELEIPEGYETVTRLNEKATEYMSTAADYFHTAFEGEVFDEDAYETANTYYYKAFEFVNYTGQVIQGVDITFQSDMDS